MGREMDNVVVLPSEVIKRDWQVARFDQNRIRRARMSSNRRWSLPTISRPHLYNLEATRAEGTTYRFAKEDRKRFGDIIHAGTPEMPYYTNSSQLPVGFTDDPFEALEKQDELQRKYTGGTVLHLYMTERISSADACKQLVRRALSNFRLPYITITPTFSICPKHGYLAGSHEYCLKCDDDLIAKKRRAACC